MSLEEIGLKYGTDKSSVTHDYLTYYEPIFAPLAERAETVIEIGVLDGASLKMWREFFANAQIVGIDIREACREHQGDRIKIEIGGQHDPAFLKMIASRYQPDMVLDDGSHIWAHQIATFEALYPTVRPGGMYAIEDLHTSSVDRYGAPDMPVATEYFGRLAAFVMTDGAPKGQVDTKFARYVRQTTRQVIAGRRFCVFQKK